MVYVYVYTSKQTTLKSKFHIPTKEFIYNLHYTCAPTPTCPNKIENKLSYSKKKYILLFYTMYTKYTLHARVTIPFHHYNIL